MLKMLQCDEFKCNGRPRGPIVFHKGLNAVIGNESGTNSVGKSTFLMILDFVLVAKTIYINPTKFTPTYLHTHSNLSLNLITHLIISLAPVMIINMFINVMPLTLHFMMEK